MSKPSYEELLKRIEDLEGSLGQIIIDYTFEDSIQKEKEFDISLNPDEVLDIKILGSSTENNVIFRTQLNEIITQNYYQAGFYYNNDGSSDNLPHISGNRKRESFYYGQEMCSPFTNIEEKIYLQKNLIDNKYYATCSMKTENSKQNYQWMGYMYGTLNIPLDEINKIKFSFEHATACFKEGSRIIIKKSKIYNL